MPRRQLAAIDHHGNPEPTIGDQMNALATLPASRLPRRPRLPMPRRRGPHQQLGAIAQPLADDHGRLVDPLLTADEVAALLQVTKAWVYAQTRAKRIPHVPLGRYVRYRRSAVVRWIVELERESAGHLAPRPVPPAGR
jgi:excisionase family DNA binding protein